MANAVVPTGLKQGPSRNRFGFEIWGARKLHWLSMLGYLWRLVKTYLSVIVTQPIVSTLLNVVLGNSQKLPGREYSNDNSTHFPRVVDETKCANHLARFLQGEGVAGMTSLLKILFFIQDLPNISRRCWCQSDKVGIQLYPATIFSQFQASKLCTRVAFDSPSDRSRSSHTCLPSFLFCNFYIWVSPRSFFVIWVICVWVFIRSRGAHSLCALCVLWDDGCKGCLGASVHQPTTRLESYRTTGFKHFASGPGA